MFLTEALSNYLNGFIYSRPQQLHNAIKDKHMMFGYINGGHIMEIYVNIIIYFQ
jgi:hypothetical protein